MSFNDLRRNAVKFVKVLKKNGLSTALMKIKHHFFISRGVGFNQLTKKELKKAVVFPSQAEVLSERGFVFPDKIKISILTPVFNTVKRDLVAMIESVINQTYKNWELCIADASDDKHDYVGSFCCKYASGDERIKYVKIENSGISGNTNKASELATGSYFALLDHDDVLHPSALFEIVGKICFENADFVYTDEAKFTKKPQDAYYPHIKQDFFKDSFFTNNYICHFTAFKRELFEKAGGLRPAFDGAQDFDLFLRITDIASKIVHIPRILYFWRAGDASTALDESSKPTAGYKGCEALQEFLDSKEIKAKVSCNSLYNTSYRIDYELTGNPLVSVIIPNKDHIEDLDTCINSIISKTTYPEYEILVVENNSEDSRTFDYYSDVQEKYKNVRVVTYAGSFNFSAICNFGANEAKGDYYLFLNNDTEVITANWMQNMMMFAQRPDVGAVGACLYFKDDTIQHAGIDIDSNGIPHNLGQGFKKGSPGYLNRLLGVQNVKAVTGACLLVSKDAFSRVISFNEDFPVCFNDVDFCLKLSRKGFLNVWTPFAELYHYESKTRGTDDTKEKMVQFKQDLERFKVENNL